jgi:glycosyltransferase involved in cell wall biosynthesis
MTESAALPGKKKHFLVSSMKVAVVSIMKNEERHVARWAASAADADYRVVLDTGSTDNSVALAEALGVVVHHAVIEPWHFARARNTLLDLLPADVDWIVNLDLDEVLGDGWRGELAKLPNDGSVNRPRYKYTWNWKSVVKNAAGDVDVAATIAAGVPGVQYDGDKITRRNSHRWVNAVHEVNVTQPGAAETQQKCGLRIYHFVDDSKSRGSYLPLLLQDVADNPENDRNVYYCARELMFHKRADESIAMFKRHLALPSATWAPERGFSMRYIARQSPSEQREQWLLRAVAEYPSGRECWLDLARQYYAQKQWLDCYWASSRCLQITERSGLYLTESDAWGWAPHDLCALSAHFLGLSKVADAEGTKAVELAPEDTRLRENLRFYRLAVGCKPE